MALRLVHIINYDVKFFAGTLTRFEKDSRFLNYPIIVVKCKEQVQALGDVGHNVRVMVKGKGLETVLKVENYDAVYFHSLPPFFWEIINYVPKDKTIIWWAWGFDIYSSVSFSLPFIPIPELKTITRKLFNNRNNVLKQSAILFLNLIQGARKYLIRKRVLERIDYFQPVISYEYELMKKFNPSFHAKEFYYPTKIPNSEPLCEKNKDDGNILMGNSATFSNNHLDVWQFVKGNYESGQKVIVPISYGNVKYARLITQLINESGVVFIKEMMPRDVYFGLIDSCSYVVMGSMRQQGMGNVSHAIRNGAKLFFFRDSVVYQYLNLLGLKVYAIEDIDHNSFKTALSLDDANRNIQIYNKEFLRRKMVLDDYLRNNAIELNDD